ncbi:MAG: hypothetical protein IJX30_09320 [Clostridia bacterium]|nr:hypothetical protein [Clostridia bacterium]MBQ8430168.1 hypothetical protein [Clostridia bacterium]MBQ8430271.1 hypothetical protein [Clostridia bacterium]
MIILYILLVAYILAINFYAFLLVKGLRDRERQAELEQQGSPLLENSGNIPSKKPEEKGLGKLFITGALGGAITIYVCMFILKYKRSELLLMVLMPLLGVLNVYIFFMFFKSGFGFLLIR